MTQPFPKLPLLIYNTESRKKEQFKPGSDHLVKMYTCGPTVYHYAHIGNFRTYIFEDLLKRTLKFFGFQVEQVMNLTDIDDKTIKGAIEKKLPILEYTQPFKNGFFADLQALAIERADTYPAATDYIGEMSDFIQKLLDKGFAYKSRDGSIYYSIDKCPNYGRLSHLKLDELQVCDRVANDEYDKENVGDFVLWKAYDPERDGHVYWESHLGKGRPGWHIECSAMAMALLGETIDIHAGGVDNIFPHHENEIAQSEALSGKKFVRYWMHAEHLLVNHKKMSKSLGNFYTLRDLLDRGYSGEEVRYMLIQTHYRTQLNFTFEGLEGARTALYRLNDFVQRMQQSADNKTAASQVADPILKRAIQGFSEGLADDLNISASLASLFDLMRECNILRDQQKLTGGDAREILYVLEEFNRVLGFLKFEEEGIPKEMGELLQKREEARKGKNWALSDSLRQEIHAKGYVIEDTPQGPRLRKI